MNLTNEIIERLRNQIRKDGLVRYDAIGAYMALWSGEPVFGNSEELKVLECEDIVYITNGTNSAFACVDSEFYQKYIAPKEATKAYSKAIQKAQEPPAPDKKSLLKRLLGL